MQCYSYSYSSQCVDFFIKKRGRGARLLEEIWPVLDRETAIKMFQRDAVRWNIYKKLVKLADRLLLGGLSAEVVQLNMVTSAKYFRKIAEKELFMLEEKRKCC